MLATFWMTAALALQAPQAGPPAPSADPQAYEIDDVVVEARRLEDFIGDFVEAVGEPPRRRGLARWHEPICVGVVNLRAERAQYIVDRVSDVARDLGVEAGEPGCRANVMIAATADAPALARALVERKRRVLDPGHSGTNAGDAALRAFQDSDRAVRWWHISLPTNSETGEIAVRLPGMTDQYGEPMAPQIRVTSASRLRSQIRDDMERVLIIVDVERLPGTNLAALADYLAFVALAQVDPEAETEAWPTILNLFSGSPDAEALTDWDMTYLRALYEPDYRLRVNPNTQRDAIARLMATERRAAAAEEDAAPAAE